MNQAADAVRAASILCGRNAMSQAADAVRNAMNQAADAVRAASILCGTP